MAIGGLDNHNNNYRTYTQPTNTTHNTTTTTTQTKEELLKELQDLYPDVNIYSGKVRDDNYSSFAGGTGLYNVAISDKYLEQALQDPKTKEKLIKTIQEIKDATNYMKNMYKARNREVYAAGFMITDEGRLNSWNNTRVLDPIKEARKKKAIKNKKSSNDALQEIIQKNREKRKLEQRKKEQKLEEQRELQRRERKRQEQQKLEAMRENTRRKSKQQNQQINNQNIYNSNTTQSIINAYRKSLTANVNVIKFNIKI